MRDSRPFMNRLGNVDIALMTCRCLVDCWSVGNMNRWVKKIFDFVRNRLTMPNNKVSAIKPFLFPTLASYESHLARQLTSHESCIQMRPFEFMTSSASGARSCRFFCESPIERHLAWGLRQLESRVESKKERDKVARDTLIEGDLRLAADALAKLAGEQADQSELDL